METEIAAKALEQFQEKCEAVFPEKRVTLSLEELRQNKKIERFGVPLKR
jgi:hypothetical protein